MSEREIVCIYCDESCHLENPKDGSVMALGCVWAPKSAVKDISLELKALKKKHKAEGELKWTKVSSSRLDFYLELVNWFFGRDQMRFRSIVIPDKFQLDHVLYNEGSPDNFYYKTYFNLLSKILDPTVSYEIYLDIKDTRSSRKIAKLKSCLIHDKWDFAGQMITQIRAIRSHEVQLLQLSDFFLGAITYSHRGKQSNSAKVQIIKAVESHLGGRKLTETSSLYESKFNTFVWTPRHERKS